MRYSEVYNAFFLRPGRKRRHRMTPQQDATEVVMRLTSERRDLPNRLRMLRHLRTISHTQSLGDLLDAATRRHIHTHHRLAHLAWTISRLRPLQRRVLDHLWNPSGRMARRAMREALSATHCAATDADVCGASEVADRRCVGASPRRDLPRVSRAARGTTDGESPAR